MVWLDGHELERNMPGKLMTGNVRKWYVDRLFRVSKKCEETCFPFNAQGLWE